MGWNPTRSQRYPSAADACKRESTAGVRRLDAMLFSLSNHTSELEDVHARRKPAILEFMAWKRRRESWRKLPRSPKRGSGPQMHWGPYQKIPGTRAGSEIGMSSSSGEVDAAKPWYRSLWILFLPVGVVACLTIFPFLLFGVGWLVLAGMLIFLIYRTWRPLSGR